MLAGHALSVTARSALPQLAALQRVPCSIWGRVSSRSRSLACRMSSTNADELRAQSCSLLGVCSSETPLLPAAEVTTLLAALPAWALSEDGRAIKRRFVSKNFVAAVTFFTRVSEVAEAEGHHPDLHLTNYRDVEIVLSTHAAGGLTMFDFITAAKLDALQVDYSPKWAKSHPELLPAQ